MLRMEIALFIIVGFVACVYFSAEKERSPLHGTFSVLLAAVLFNLAMDGATVYTVNSMNRAAPMAEPCLPWMARQPPLSSPAPSSREKATAA